MTRTRVNLAGVSLIVLMAIGSVLLWLGIPYFWIWLASRMADSSQPSMGLYFMVIIGIPASMVVVGKVLSKLNRIYGEVTGTTPEVRVRMPWHRSLRGENEGRHPRTVLDIVMVCSVAAALTVFGIWFLFFAGSSLPTGP